MRRVPIVATLVVLLAVATMIALGVWQLQRAGWKEALLARYAAAEGRPLLDGLPALAGDTDTVAFRRTTLRCAAQGKVVEIGGRNRAGRTGYRAISPCRLGDGRVLMVDLGWSPPNALLPARTAAEALPFTGPLIPDPPLAARVLKREASAVPLLLVAERVTSPRQPSIPPSITDIPNNHRAYAVQWFLFAAVAGIIYMVALRRRAR